MRSLKNLVTTALILIITILLFFSYNSFSSHLDTQYEENSVPMDKGWEFRWGNGDKSEIFELPFVAKNASENDILWISNTMPMKKFNDATLFIRTSQQYIKVYIDGRQIYSYNSETKSQDYNLPGSAFQFIRLPQGYEGKLIEISLVSPYKAYSGHVNSIYIGNKSSHILNVFYKYGWSLLIAFIIILLGLILLILFIVMKSFKSRIEGFLFMGIFSCLSGIWIASESKIIQFIIDSPVLLLYSACLSLFLMPIPLLQFIIITYKPQRSGLLAGFVKIFVGYTFIVTILQIFYHNTFLQSLIIFHILILFCIATMIYISIKEMLSGNKSIRLFFFGCIILCIFSLLDLSGFYFSRDPGLNAQGFMQLGFLLFILIMTASLGHFIKDIFEKQAKIDIYSVLAYTDILTGLKNRTSFEEKISNLNNEIKLESAISIILFDLNNLKFINDSRGHKVGDKIICEASKLINQSFQKFGETYRIGGDEFVVICLKCSEMLLNERLSLFEQKIHEYNMSNVEALGIAYGMSSFEKEVDKDLHSVLIRADEAMYVKKQNQKNSL